MKIEINTRWGMGSCYCGDVYGTYIVEDGKVLVDEANGNEKWQQGKATKERAYNAYIFHGDRIRRFSASSYFASLDKKMQKMLVAEAVHCPRVKGDGPDPRKNHFWYLIADRDHNFNYSAELNEYWRDDKHIKITP
jgi:hypothetical protein